MAKKPAQFNANRKPKSAAAPRPPLPKPTAKPKTT